MDDEQRRRRLDELLDQAMLLPRERREAFLRRECVGNSASDSKADAELFADALALIGGDQDADQLFAEVPIWKYFTKVADLSGQSIEEDLNTLENFRIKGVLGEGGMSRVFLGIQRDPPRPVAIKVMKPNLADEQLLLLFEREGRCLARMRHENLVRFYGTGTTPSGRSYCATEFFPAIPLIKFVRENRLELKTRLLLFIEVCDGLQHAHQKGILHRDLKPSNILVEGFGDQTLVKISDFGMAPILAVAEPSKCGTHSPAPLSFGDSVYRSPEQIIGMDMDVRSDVYALGALLYELVTGYPPFDPKTLQRLPHAAQIGILVDQPPIRASVRVRELGEDGFGTGPGGSLLAHGFLGDLDSIVATALAKDPECRYQGVDALARDLRNCLEHRPVSVRPPSAWYAFQKTLRRHFLAAGLTAAMIFAMVVGMGLTFYGARPSQRRGLALAQHSQNDCEAEKYREMCLFYEESLTAFLPTWFTVQSPVIDFLQFTAGQIQPKLGHNSYLVGRMYQTFGKTHFEMGQYNQALAFIDPAFNVRRETLGLYAIETLESLQLRGNALIELGQFEAAELCFAAVVDASCPGPLEQLAERGLADALKRKAEIERAVPLYRQVLIEQWLSLGPEDSQTLTTMSGFADALFKQDDHLAAQEFLEPVMADIDRLGPVESLPAIHLWVNLSFALSEISAAEALGQAVGIYRDRAMVQGLSHPETLTSHFQVASFLVKMGRFPEAEPICREVYQARVRDFGADHPESFRVAQLLEICWSNLQNQAN